MENREQQPSAAPLVFQTSTSIDWIINSGHMDSQYSNIFDGGVDNMMVRLTEEGYRRSRGMQGDMEAPQKPSQAEKGLAEKKREVTYALQNPDIRVLSNKDDCEPNRIQMDSLLEEETPKMKKMSRVKKFLSFLTLGCVKEEKVRLLYKQEDKLLQSAENNGDDRLSKSDSDAKAQLFGQPLCELCPDDYSLPKPIAEMLALLRKNVLSAEGAFRTPCSEHMMDIIEQLNSGLEVDLEDLPLNLVVGLLKHFLKELPGSLLVTELYDDWMKALDTKDPQQREEEITKVADKLQETHRFLLQQLMSVLHLIVESADITKMNAPHLAMSIGPTLLRLDDTPMDELGEKMNNVTKLTHYLIEHHEILGEDAWNLLDTDEDSNTLSSMQQDYAHVSANPEADGNPGE